MKTILISIGGIVLIGLFFLAYKLTSLDEGISQVSQTATTTTQGNTESSISDTSSLPLVSSQTALSITDSTQVEDILENSDLAKDPMNPGYYYLGYHTNQGGADPTATIAPPYIIEYIDTTHYFNIALLQEPIGTTRETMQQYMMFRLKLSEDQMCKLDYMVSVPEKVNAFYAGKSLGFSFCPGATPLPK